jgi:menaquinone-dependent protoporphyrinogen oxidase
MKVLVSAASRHGATAEVAEAIAAALVRRGADAVVVAPADVAAVDGFGGAVIGSAVYVGRWLEPARDLLESHRDGLARIPVWLFSSGPVGDPPKPVDEPIDVAALVALVGAREHRVIPGRIDKQRLGLGERAILAAVRAPEGDFRPWPEIEAWAREIADALGAVPEVVPAG